MVLSPIFICFIYCSSSLYSWKTSKNSGFYSIICKQWSPCSPKTNHWQFQILYSFCSYQITLSLLERFRLMIEYEKTEVFHFSRSYGVLILLHLIFLQLEVWSFVQEYMEILGVHFWQKNYSSDNILTFMQIKLFLLSSV